MALTGTISKTEFVNEFNSRVKNAVINGIVWHSGNVPETIGGADAPATAPASDFGSQYFDSLSASDITENVITANDVINAIVSVCRDYTRLRNYRIEWYTTGDSTGLAGSVSNMSALASKHQQSFSSSNVPIRVGTLIQDNFFSSIVDQLQQLKNNTVTWSYTTHVTHSTHYNGRSKR